jgi:hypothetical protein
MAAGGAESLTSVSIGLVSHPEDGTGAEELMAAADRAMYQAKKLGKNQISGNPRPRPALLARRSIAEDEPAPPPTQPEPAPEPRPVAEEPRVLARTGATAPTEERAVAVELGPVVADIDDDEADAHVVRRQIATASRSFDPDHQIRRAMDAFLSPGSRDERPTPDH